MAKNLSKYVIGETRVSIVDQDGSTHLNVYSFGKTELGRLLSNFSISNTETALGRFKTLEGLYHVLRIADYFVSVGLARGYDWDELLGLCPELAELQVCSGAEAISKGRLLKKKVYGGTKYKPGCFSPTAGFIFHSALVTKLAQMKIGGRAIGNVVSEYLCGGGQLTHYYVYNTKVTWPPFFEWLPELIARCAVCIDPYGSEVDVSAVINDIRGDYDGAVG